MNCLLYLLMLGIIADNDRPPFRLQHLELGGNPLIITNLVETYRI